ncbi:MAG: hypothetical protein NT068_00140 [Candidatus Nomurabacteria bacterium]|nr:hypothetical protein [Candidatus Nomurabacteria bacterium]
MENRVKDTLSLSRKTFKAKNPNSLYSDNIFFKIIYSPVWVILIAFLLLSYFLNFSIYWWHYLLIFIITPLLPLLRNFRENHKEAVKVTNEILRIEKENLKKEKHKETVKMMIVLKQKKNIDLLEIKANYYVFKSIVPYSCKDTTKSCFIVSFTDLMYSDALPEITVNTKKVNISVFSDDQVLCWFDNNADQEYLHWKCSKSEETTLNPYHIFWRSNNVSSRWQCEGHTHEKIALINKNIFPNAVEGVVYPFDLFINNKFKVRVLGEFKNNRGYIEVKLPSVKKNDCINRECFLRFVFDKSKDFPLGKPELL